MKLIYAISAIEAGRLVLNSKIFKTLKNKIGFNPEYNTKQAVEELSVRIWELEQLTYEILKLQGGKNEKSDVHNQ